MPNPEQIRYFWLKWIDRQFAKVDPSHVKMRVEVSKIGEDSATAEDFAEAALAQDLTNKLPPLGNRSNGPSANKAIEHTVIASDSEAIQTKPQLETAGLLRFADKKQTAIALIS
jgi:hypothetical protein